MLKILIVTHGNLGKEMANSAEIIIGKQNGINTLSLMPGDSIEDLKAQIGEIIRNNGKTTTLVLVDLFGGSPSNNVASFLNIYNGKVECVTGVNLPMIITALMERDNSTIEALKEKCIKAGKDGIRDMGLEIRGY